MTLLPSLQTSSTLFSSAVPFAVPSRDALQRHAVNFADIAAQSTAPSLVLPERWPHRPFMTTHYNTVHPELPCRGNPPRTISLVDSRGFRSGRPRGSAGIDLCQSPACVRICTVALPEEGTVWSQRICTMHRYSRCAFVVRL